MLNSMFLNPLSEVLPPFPSNILNRFCYLYLKIEIKKVSKSFFKNMFVIYILIGGINKIECVSRIKLPE